MKGRILPRQLPRWSPSPRASRATVQVRCEGKHGVRERYWMFLTVVSVLLLSSLSIIVKAGAAQSPYPKMARKAWGKPTAALVHDAYASVARPLLVNLLRKAQRIGTRFLYPEYSTLGRAWFNALVVDLSEYVLRRSTGANLEERYFESDLSAPAQGALNGSGTRWPAASSSLLENGYQAAPEAAPLLGESKNNGFNAPYSAELEGGSRPPEEESSSTGQVLRLNKHTILWWKEVFEDTFMGVAKKVLPRHVLELVKSMDENQYSALRPTLEHALYMTLTKFYPTLMSSGTSEAILPNFHVAVSSDTCPFSLYTSYTFMALIAAGRSGVDALFLADEMMQHYKSDEPYISPECKAFSQDMREALILDSMTLYELVGRTAGAVQKSFYNLNDLVTLQKATLLGTTVKSKDVDKEGHDHRDKEGTSVNVALQEMVAALASEHTREAEDGDASLNPRFIAEAFERIKATSREAPANIAMSARTISDDHIVEADPLASLILKEKSSILGTT